MHRALKDGYRHTLANVTLAIQAKTALDFYLLASRYRQKTAGASADTRLVLEEIEDLGYSVIPNYRDSKWCAQTVLEVDEIFAAQSGNVVKGDDFRIYGAEYLSSRIRDFANDQKLSDLAEAYFGGFQVFTLANVLRYTKGNRGSGGGWHRDGYYRELKAILYLTDVGPTNGPFQIVERSHHFREMMRAVTKLKLQWRHHRMIDKEEEIAHHYAAYLKTLVSGAGTLIVFDSSCIHRGMPIVEGTRYALTNYCWHANYYSRSQVRRVLDDYGVVSPDMLEGKVLGRMGQSAQRGLPRSGP